MTQEEKELLLKDISARLRYGVKFKAEQDISPMEIHYIRDEEVYTRQFKNLPYWIGSIKPYLRPMSSMTEEERGEFRKVGGVMSYSPQHDTWAISAFAPEAYDWLNKNMFDYRGLIEKGLALEALKEMYKI